MFIFCLSSCFPSVITHTETRTYTNTHTHDHSRQHIQVGVFEWENPQAGWYPGASAVLDSSAFEVDTDSWMLEKLCAPSAEEKAQRNINGLRLDTVMRAHTYTVNTGLAEKPGWWRTGWGKNFPAEENKPKTQSVNKNHTSQRCGPLEVLTLSVEGSPKVSEKPWFPLGPDRWSPVELASWKRSLKAEVNNREVRVKCLQSTTVGKWGDDAWGVREQKKEEMDVRKGKTERVLERAAVMGDDSGVRSDQIPEQRSSAIVS